MELSIVPQASAGQGHWGILSRSSPGHMPERGNGSIRAGVLRGTYPSRTLILYSEFSRPGCGVLTGGVFRDNLIVAGCPGSRWTGQRVRVLRRSGSLTAAYFI